MPCACELADRAPGAASDLPIGMRDRGTGSAYMPMHADAGTSADCADWRRPGWILFSIVRLSVYGAMMLTFYHLASWMSARPIETLRADVVAGLPAGCPAAVSSHGDYSCVWEGVAADHPKRVAAEALLLTVCCVFLI